MEETAPANFESPASRFSSREASREQFSDVYLCGTERGYAHKYRLYGTGARDGIDVSLSARKSQEIPFEIRYSVIAQLPMGTSEVVVSQFHRKGSKVSRNHR